MQKDSVSRVLNQYPAASGRCAEAADEIFPIAQRRDKESRIWQIRPAEGRYILPKLAVGKLWYYHVTVEIEAHCVDALTGPEGTMRVAYPETHWKEPDALKWIIDDRRRPVI